MGSGLCICIFKFREYLCIVWLKMQMQRPDPIPDAIVSVG
jgi:hypothetical protein